MAGIGIITFLHNDNFGSTLQAWALQHVLLGMGHRCEHIDYRPDRAEKLRNLICSGNRPGLILEGMRKRQVRSGQTGARAKSEAIPAFYEREMRLSRPCRNQKELRKVCEAYDTLICGSDQIWNPTWLNPAYFLPFAREGQRKIAYAPSLGVSAMPAPAKVRKLRALTAGFDALSVRETEGADLLERITGRRPAVMPDPVCLPALAEWERLASPVDMGGKPRLVCYFIGENPACWDTVNRLAREKGLTPLVLPVTAESFGRGFELLDGAGPTEFLGAIRGAAMVCTDSFHATVFSALFQRPCEVCLRDREGDPESKNSRILSFQRLQRELGLEEMRSRGLAFLSEALS